MLFFDDAYVSAEKLDVEKEHEDYCLERLVPACLHVRIENGLGLFAYRTLYLRLFEVRNTCSAFGDCCDCLFRDVACPSSDSKILC